MIIFIVTEIKSLQSHLTLEEIHSNDAKLRKQVLEMTNLTSTVFVTNLCFTDMLKIAPGYRNGREID